MLLIYFFYLRRQTTRTFPTTAFCFCKLPTQRIQCIEIAFHIVDLIYQYVTIGDAAYMEVVS